MSPPRLQEILHDDLKDESKQESGNKKQAAQSSKCTKCWLSISRVKMTSLPEQTFAFKSNRQSKAKIFAHKGFIFPSITVFFFYICFFFFF